MPAASLKEGLCWPFRDPAGERPHRPGTHKDAGGSHGVLLGRERHGGRIKHQPKQGLVFEHDDCVSARKTVYSMERLVRGESIAQERSHNGSHGWIASRLESQFDQGESARWLRKEPFDHVRRVLLNRIGTRVVGGDPLQASWVGRQALEHASGHLNR